MLFPASKKQQETSYSPVDDGIDRSDTDASIKSKYTSAAERSNDPAYISRGRLWIIVDLLLLLLPIAFIALAALAYHLDGEELSSFGRKVQEASLLGPTVYPLAFAALAGRSLKKIALWRAQEGTTLGLLEHLIGSQSLVGTVGHAITLHSFNILTIGLLGLWALSPLGGQSALRLVHEANSTISGVQSTFYAIINATSDFDVYSGTLNGDEPRNTSQLSITVNPLNRVNGVLGAAMSTADTLELAPFDTWNHAKIPRIDELEAAEENNDTTRPWYIVDRHANYSYAALTGVPVINLFQFGWTNLTIPYEYMYTSCQLLPENKITTNKTQTGVLVSYPNTMSQVMYLRNLKQSGRLYDIGQFKSNVTDSIEPNILPERRFFFYTSYPNGTQKDRKGTMNLLYGSSLFTVLEFFLFECSLKSVTVEVKISCEGSACAVSQIRRMDRNALNMRGWRSPSTPYDVVNDRRVNKQFINALTGIGGQMTWERPNPVDSWLYGMLPWGDDPDTPGLGLHPVTNWTSYLDNPQKTIDMSRRLTSILNTFWDASRWPLAITRDDPFAKISLNSSTKKPNAPLTMNKTEATTLRNVPVYRTNKGWVAGLLFCSTILLLLGIFSVFLSFRIMVPDIFDYVSSFTRDNPYVDAPQGKSALNGAARARMLRALPVQLGDVDAGKDVGYITVRSVDGKRDREQGKVRRNRMYR